MVGAEATTARAAEQANAALIGAEETRATAAEQANATAITNVLGNNYEERLKAGFSLGNNSVVKTGAPYGANGSIHSAHDGTGAVVGTNINGGGDKVVSSILCIDIKSLPVFNPTGPEYDDDGNETSPARSALYNANHHQPRMAIGQLFILTKGPTGLTDTTHPQSDFGTGQSTMGTLRVWLGP